MPVEPGLVINPIYDSSVLAQPNAAQIEASVGAEIAVLENLISTPLTINLTVGWGENGGSPLGSTLASAVYPKTIASYDAVTSAYASRVVQPPTILYVPTISVSTPDAMALGLIPTAPVSVSIGFSNSTSWDFSGGTTIASGAYDFGGVVLNEVTQALGRFSSPSTLPSTLDLFRFAAGEGPDATAAYPTIDSFSIDNGTTLLPLFSGGSADWVASSGAPDAFATPVTGEALPLTQADINVFHALGYQLIPTRDYSIDIRSYYDEYFGRDATAGEVGVWQGYVYDDGDLNTLRYTLVHSLEGLGYAAAEIKYLVIYYDGTDDFFAERAYRTEVLNGGESFTQVRNEIISSLTGQYYSAAQINLIYDIYFGRDANPGEITTWQAAILAGDGFDAVHNAVASAPEAIGHTAVSVQELYHTYFGRDPRPSELTVWQNTIDGPTATADFLTVYEALVTSAEGQAYIAAQTVAIYEKEFGRAPTAAELSVWEGNFESGVFFNYFVYEHSVASIGATYVQQGPLLSGFAYETSVLLISPEHYMYQDGVTTTYYEPILEENQHEANLMFGKVYSAPG